jgi:hypothetical protein
MILERGAYVLRVAVQVMPGEANKGLFIDLKAPSPGAGEVSPILDLTVDTYLVSIICTRNINLHIRRHKSMVSSRVLSTGRCVIFRFCVGEADDLGSVRCG